MLSVGEDSSPWSCNCISPEPVPQAVTSAHPSVSTSPLLGETGWQEGAFLMVGSDKMPVHGAPVSQSTLKASLVKNRPLWHIFRLVTLPLSMLEAHGDFSPIFTMRTWCSWRSTPHKCGDAQQPGPTTFLTLKRAQTESPVIHPSHGSGFPTLALAPAEMSAPGKLWYCVCLPLLFEGQKFAL